MTEPATPTATATVTHLRPPLLDRPDRAADHDGAGDTTEESEPEMPELNITRARSKCHRRGGHG